MVDDPEWEVSERVNREALVALLGESGEKTGRLMWRHLGREEFEKPANIARGDSSHQNPGNPISDSKSEVSTPYESVDEALSQLDSPKSLAFGKFLLLISDPETTGICREPVFRTARKGTGLTGGTKGTPALNGSGLRNIGVRFGLSTAFNCERLTGFIR